MNYCTLSDKKYLLKGLTLYRNLARVTKGHFLLHYLCLDDETYETLSKLKASDLLLYKISTIKEDYPATFEKLENIKECKYGDKYSMYCWAMTPIFLNYLVCKHDMSFIYADSDIYFYHDPEKIIDYKIQRSKNVGIHRHRFKDDKPYNPITNTAGEFNVGVISFLSGEISRKILYHWKEWVINPENPYYETYGTCGDQKYLDLFIPLFGESNICIFDDNSGIGHGAPWNFMHYGYMDKGVALQDEIIHEGKREKLLFNHFSHFTYDLEKNNWSSSVKGEWVAESHHPMVKGYYEEYFQEIKKSNELLFSFSNKNF